MKNLFYIFFVTILFSCGGNHPQTTKVSSNISSVKYAKNFTLIQRKDYVELHIIGPNSNTVEAKFALVKRGWPAQLPADLTRIDVPVKKIGAYSTNFIGMIDALGETPSIKATTSEKYIYNKAVKKGIQKGEVLTSDFDGSDSPSTLLMKEIHLLMYSGFGDAYPNEEKLKQVGIICLANYDWKETHPLGKAEWIKLFGALYNKTEEADAYFNQIEKDYLTIKRNASHLKKKVIVGCLVADIWYASAGKSYMAGIMKDAGLDYIYKNTEGTGSNSYTLSQIIRDEAKCSIWIDAEAKNMNALLKVNPKFATFKTVKEKQVYSYLNNSNYYWEYSSLHPEWLLEDFVTIGNSQNKKMHFYQKLK